MIHYEQKGNYFVLLGVGFNLMAYTLGELREQAKKLYNFDISTVLN